MERELAAQAVSRSVAESILASPVVTPQTTPQITATSPSSVSLETPTSPPTSLLEDLKISDDHEGKEEDKGEEGDGVSEGEGEDMCNLFIGDLPRSCTEDQLKSVFSKHGDVLMVDVKRDKVTHNNLGYGFVQFKTREQAIAAKNALDGTEIGNRKVRIGWAQKNTTLFVGDLDGTVTTEKLREIFGKFGPLVEDETFVKSGSGKFGFVRFKNRVDAEKAKQEMNKKVIGSRPVRIGWGDNNIQKHCVHVQFNVNQGANLNDIILKKHFEKFGPVVNVSLPRYANKRLKGYGFVHYQESEEGEKAASKAIAALADTKIGNVTLRCSYGKRQAYRRRNTKFRNFQRPPMYSWVMSMGPNGNWTPVQVPAMNMNMHYVPNQMNINAINSLNPMNSMNPMNSVNSMSPMNSLGPMGIQQPIDSSSNPYYAQQPRAARNMDPTHSSLYIPHYYPAHPQIYFGQNGYYGMQQAQFSSPTPSSPTGVTSPTIVSASSPSLSSSSSSTTSSSSPSANHSHHYSRTPSSNLNYSGHYTNTTTNRSHTAQPQPSSSSSSSSSSSTSSSSSSSSSSTTTPLPSQTSSSSQPSSTQTQLPSSQSST